MEIATSQSLSRIWRLALVGAATAFAWIVISLLLGLGSAHAHADDADSEGNGLLGAITSVVDRTATAVTSTVTTVTSEVTGVVNTVVDVTPAPVQQPVREVVKTVGTVVSTVTAPVSDVVSGGVVGAVTDPVVEIVKQVPIVGGIVTGLGVDEAIDDLGGTVDDTLGGLVGAVDDTGSTIGEPSTGTPGLPGLPGLPEVPALPGAPTTVDPSPTFGVASGLAFPASAVPSVILSRFAGYGAVPLVSAESAVVASSASASSDARGPLSPAAGLCPPTASSSGPGGTGLGAWALVALGPLAAHRAWVRRAGPEDEHAPPAPAGSTDVSPD